MWLSGIINRLDRLGTGAVINVALVESELETKVTAGENSGRTLKSDHVVREFKTSALEHYGVVNLTIPDPVAHGPFEVIAYVQDQQDMRVYAVERVVLD
jgi:hypothetical protein